MTDSELLRVVIEEVPHYYTADVVFRERSGCEKLIQVEAQAFCSSFSERLKASWDFRKLEKNWMAFERHYSGKSLEVFRARRDRLESLIFAFIPESGSFPTTEVAPTHLCRKVAETTITFPGRHTRFSNWVFKA